MINLTELDLGQSRRTNVVLVTFGITFNGIRKQKNLGRREEVGVGGRNVWVYICILFDLEIIRIG